MYCGKKFFLWNTTYFVYFLSFFVFRVHYIHIPLQPTNPICGRPADIFNRQPALPPRVPGDSSFICVCVFRGAGFLKHRVKRASPSVRIFIFRSSFFLFSFLFPPPTTTRRQQRVDELFINARYHLQAIPLYTDTTSVQMVFIHHNYSPPPKKNCS